MSAADQLMLWHGRTAPQVLQEPERTRSVVLLAACLHDRASAVGLDGAAVAEVQLKQAADVLERYPVSALEACRTAPAASGGDVVDGLLGDYGRDGFERIRQPVRQALARHLADGGPHVRIADRRPALRDTSAHLYMDY
ncbi:hypothetical protein ACUN29_41470 (plasmid) [Streptomyces sp. WC2508]|uniref:hypothetical protein n=1 Tax=Streptomyces sp. WC2508 TaxID=3461405 RepID=UPI004044F434